MRKGVNGQYNKLKILLSLSIVFGTLSTQYIAIVVCCTASASLNNLTLYISVLPISCKEFNISFCRCNPRYLQRLIAKNFADRVNKTKMFLRFFSKNEK